MHASAITQGMKSSIPFRSETNRVTSSVRAGGFNFRTSTPQTSAVARRTSELHLNRVFRNNAQTVWMSSKLSVGIMMYLNRPEKVARRLVRAAEGIARRSNGTSLDIKFSKWDVNVVRRSCANFWRRLWVVSGRKVRIGVGMRTRVGASKPHHPQHPGRPSTVPQFGCGDVVITA